MGPKAPERYWTPESIETLAKRLNLPNDPDMQDWAYEVADSDRIDEFMAVFVEFSDQPDIRYTLMDILIQSLPFKMRRMTLGGFRPSCAISGNVTKGQLAANSEIASISSLKS